MWDLLLVFEVRAWHSLRIMCEFTVFLPNPQLSWPAFRQAGRKEAERLGNNYNMINVFYVVDVLPTPILCR